MLMKHKQVALLDKLAAIEQDMGVQIIAYQMDIEMLVSPRLPCKCRQKAKSCFHPRVLRFTIT